MKVQHGHIPKQTHIKVKSYPKRFKSNLTNTKKKFWYKLIVMREFKGLSENSKLYNLHCKTIENMPPICLRFYCPPFLLLVLHVLLSFFERGGGFQCLFMVTYHLNLISLNFLGVPTPLLDLSMMFSIFQQQHFSLKII